MRAEMGVIGAPAPMLWPNRPWWRLGMRRLLRPLRPVWRGLLDETHGRRVQMGVVAEAAPKDRRREVDDLVLQRARQGDRDAFGAIVARYEERLRILAFHMLRDAEQMNDVVQDTFVKAYAGLPGYRGEAALGTWLHSICCRVCLDHLRTARDRPQTEEIHENLADPADDAERLALRDEVAVALATLPPAQRAVLLLVDREGYDYATVAEALDVPLGTVASRLSHARKAFRAAFDQGGLR
jgi:RNA polymerase sigma-70 factor, ECF subfamily